MKTIPLTQGQSAIVDDEDYEELSRYKWLANRSSHNKIWKVRRSCGTYMSRQIMDAPDYLEVDHRNGDTLDNRRDNLRLCTHAENMRNIQKRTKHSSAYKGVHGWPGRWRSSIRFEGQLYHLGYYKSELQAAAFYDIAAIYFFGEFANLNFPEHLQTYKTHLRNVKK